MRVFVSIFFVIFYSHLFSQLNRYPYIQSTTQTSTIIAWKTDNTVIGRVKYGLNPNNLDNSILESGASKHHAITLTGLQKDTKYYYQILTGNTVLAEEYFNTAKDSTDQNFSFIQYGDCGFNSTAQHEIGALMEADSAEFAVVCGDVDQGGVPHVTPGSGGDNYDDIFFDVYNNGTTTKMLSRECHYTAIGNHDTYADNGATYVAEFHLPHNNAENSERYYSFTWGDAKFIALDVITPYDPTTVPINQLPIDQRYWTDFRPGSPQYQFLEDELKCNDKKWVFVYFHEGPWTNYWGADYYLPNSLGGDYYQFEGNLMVRQYLVPLFEQYGVDFVLVGHSHLYEQAYKNGVWYITSGGAGDVAGNSQNASNPEILKSIIDNMYVKYYVDSNTVRYDVINDENNIIDTFSLTKTYVDYKVTPVATNPTCAGGNDGTATLNIQGPKPPYTVEWFDGTTGNTKNNLSAGTYYAYVKNAYGCEKVTSVTINPTAPYNASILSYPNNYAYCENDSVLLYADGNYTNFIWSNGQTTDSIYVSTSGAISLTATDTNNCVVTSLPIQISEATLPVANIVFANNDSVYNFLCPDVNATTYYWDFNDGNYDTTSTNLATHTFEANGIYNVSLTAENDCGTSTFTKEVEINYYISSIRDLYVNNALNIAPNPMKDYADVSVTGLGNNLTVEIYNIIGELVYHKEFDNNQFKIYKNELGIGTYFIKVMNDKKQFAYTKIMVN
ncbi:MAG: metallophosphoesterase [Bacteroidetes bacterium]|nr:metallophosphoesterase [Bacteroidota bacterium]